MYDLYYNMRGRVVSGVQLELKARMACEMSWLAHLYSSKILKK